MSATAAYILTRWQERLAAHLPAKSKRERQWRSRLASERQRARQLAEAKERSGPEDVLQELRRLWSEDALHMSGYHIASETLRLLGLPPCEEVQERQN